MCIIHLNAVKAKQGKIRMAKQKIIIELGDKIDKCNWDLKAANKEIEVKENEKKELQENLDKVLSICVSVCDWSTYVSMYVLLRINLFIIV